MEREQREYELAIRARDGDQEALAELVEQIRLRLFALAFAQLHHYDDAQDVLPVVYFIRIGGRDHYGNTAFGQSLRNFRSRLPVPKVEIDESKVRRTSFRKRHRTHTAGGPSDYFMTGRENVFLKLHSQQWFILDDQHAERDVNHPNTLQQMEAR